MEAGPGRGWAGADSPTPSASGFYHSAESSLGLPETPQGLVPGQALQFRGRAASISEGNILCPLCQVWGHHRDLLALFSALGWLPQLRSPGAVAWTTNLSLSELQRPDSPFPSLPTLRGSLAVGECFATWITPAWCLLLTSPCWYLTCPSPSGCALGKVGN